ncbi:MAG: L-rhamnose mutarotase [Bacteroidaceae bacterium]|nr:L-rhamnose mutarotase [Bacteroidaceae bacterium]
MYLKPGCEEEYKKRHAQLWPEMKKMLAEQGVKNYSIFWDKETNMLFGYQEVEGEGGSQDCGADPICQKWWEFMEDIMATHPDHSPISVPLIERFHLD